MFMSAVKNWMPFRIDALGILTIVGAVEVDHAVGRLVSSRFVERAPLLGAYTIANNQITQPIPGFALYNITDGILATDLTGWFARWLLSQPFTFTSTTVHVAIVPPPRGHERSSVPSLLSDVLCVSFMLAIIVLSGLMGDWWGFVNGVSMAISVVVRQIVLQQNRQALDATVAKNTEEPDVIVKVFVTLPTGRAVTVLSPRRIVIDCLLTTPRPHRPLLYDGSRALGWIAFGSHIISLGMASLFSQLLSVILLIISTVILARRIGDDESRIGSRLRLECLDAKGKDFRAAAYARLRLTEKEEESMLQWNLFPHKSNDHWWRRYRECLSDPNVQSFQNWDTLLSNKSV
jgi:hypothetical protein